MDGGAVNPVLSAHHAELSLADVKRFLPPSFLKQLKKVYLCGNFGDPVAAADCLEVLRYLRSVEGGPRVGLFTNGGMRNAAWWKELGALMQPAGRAFVRFAIDGDESTNHLYRQHVVWSRLLANMEAFIAAGGVAEWDFIVFEHNEHQVEQMRALAERLGFTKFNAKKTARFIDKKKGGVKECTPVKDLAGEVVRHLRPPKDPQWQNEAALHSVQLAVEKHGSMESYYDNCEVQCKVAREGEIYISADGLAFPCCWLAAEMYRADLANSQRQIVRLIRAANPLEGLAAQSVMQRGGIAAVVDKKGGLFHKLVTAAMHQPSVSAGRLRTCSAVCGADVCAFKKQFVGASQQLDPELREARSIAEPAKSAKAGAKAPVLVWYGSETGNAERLALKLGETLGSTAEVSSPPATRADVELALQDRKALVLVLATWGDGDPTTDVLPFFSWLEEVSRTHVGDVSLPVAVYGVGSSLWPRFNAAAKRAWSLADVVGAPMLAPLGEGDVAKGTLDDHFEQWSRDSLIPALRARGLTSGDGPPAFTITRQDVDAICLTVKKCVRLAVEDPVARYCEIELEGSLRYGAGDAIGVLPEAKDGLEQRARWYTVSSAPSGESSTVSTLRLTVREVESGACSPWLCSIREGEVVRCLPPRRPSPLLAAWDLRRQSGQAPPLLLVANGAGVAPFIALMETLELERTMGRVAPACSLWMGCRRAPEALPHSVRLDAFQRNGVLIKVSIAESRPLNDVAKTGACRFVQDSLALEADELGRLLFGTESSDGQPAPGALMLVCGSALMGSAVRSLIADIAVKFGSSIETLEEERRYVAELW
eukprot:TRINITY_DN64841_c0_g1_i1.p1 TRINITY_DN64841_c0_g1~~TRINITY_DN64841_c0_g1_i1.p1  ORF type:complete len:936 (-),score=104.73 TRINITY_DN64841_c0_g1_i1:447-2915(-)